jgi:hypothetical protein
VGNDPGFTRSSPRENQQWSIAVLDCFLLRKVEWRLEYGVHPSASSAWRLLPQQGFEIRQFGVRIDTQNPLGISHRDMGDMVLFGHCKGHHIGEILFSLGVIALHTPQGRKKEGGLQTVHTTIDLRTAWSPRHHALLQSHDPSIRVA